MRTAGWLLGGVAATRVGVGAFRLGLEMMPPGCFQVGFHGPIVSTGNGEADGRRFCNSTTDT